MSTRNLLPILWIAILFIFGCSDDSKDPDTIQFWVNWAKSSEVSHRNAAIGVLATKLAEKGASDEDRMVCWRLLRELASDPDSSVSRLANHHILYLRESGMVTRELDAAQEPPPQE